jgi:hypothetical protein
MFETSKDILNIALAIWTGVLTFFICWGIYYLVSIIRNVKEITDSVKDKLQKVDVIIDKIHDKIEKTSSNIGLLTEVIKRAIAAFMDWQKGDNDQKDQSAGRQGKKSKKLKGQ